ncbi:EAL domain-containing protein [Roseomonas sp. CECT 9278]|uniref:EAL domain-containing protein n=1 Tax=Roseomonas sp. CECT 9278 TaxID=2845823 RepID=UPI001E2ED055|nr:EAL domain-containing protein [Roseomonas sp. CECT 9278]CAH0287873.1 putative signaling protein [Roseomonas sp. CECT 9278]
MLKVYACITEQHDIVLVAVAAVLCAIGAHTTFAQLHLAGQGNLQHRLRWGAVAAVTTGVAIWATHFVAMLAFDPGVPSGYDPAGTVLSLLLPILLSGAAFAIALCGPGVPRALGAGALLGLGVGAMHYTGMAAFEVAGLKLWDHGTVVVSVVLGVALTMAALRLGLAAQGPGGRLGAAALLALGICALHFIGMGAVTILPDAGGVAPAGAVTRDRLAALVGFAAFCLLAASLAAAVLTSQSRRRRKAEAERFRALVDAAVEGLLICDGETIVESNSSAQALLGQDAQGLVGRSLAAVVQAGELRQALLDPAGTTIETEIDDAQGRPVAVELVSRSILHHRRPHQVIALRDLRDRRRAEERIRFLAHHDPLTRLPNRAGFADRLQRLREVPGRAAEPFALLALDLDRFKVVNDTLGHAMGDALLVKVAHRLRAAVRSTDLVARLGGDEFAVVQFAPGQPEAATALAERLIDLLSRPFLIDGQVLNIGTSVGIALQPQDGVDLAELARSADLALYRAKSEGRGTYRFFETEMDTRMQRRRLLELELRTALAMRQFHLLYQPQVDVDSTSIVGFEALIRWTHPVRGVVSPADFIPLAEETGLIIPIGEWVLREACREAAGWPGAPFLSVNLSPVQFRSPGLVEAVRSACALAGFDPRRLELEVTESVLLSDSTGTIETLRALKEFGVRIAMDDFGTGYSSLSYLRSFPFDKIKIDRSFVCDVTEDGETAAIVRAIIGLGRSLGMRTTVEGVETQAQFDHLRAEGCDQVQGYLLGRPLAPEAAAALLKDGQPQAAAA